MATVEVLYRTRQERAAAVQDQASRGLVMLHDDHGVGPEGENRLTFTDNDTRGPGPVPERVQRIRQLRDQGTRTGAELDELVRLIAAEI